MEFFWILAVILWIKTVQGILPPSWKAGIGEAPYIAYFSDGYGYCGGAVIQEEYVLSLRDSIKIDTK